MASWQYCFVAIAWILTWESQVGKKLTVKKGRTASCHPLTRKTAVVYR